MHQKHTHRLLFLLPLRLFLRLALLLLGLQLRVLTVDLALALLLGLARLLLLLTDALDARVYAQRGVDDATQTRGVLLLVGDEEEPEDLLTLDPKEWKVRPKHLKCVTDVQCLLL